MSSPVGGPNNENKTVIDVPDDDLEDGEIDDDDEDEAGEPQKLNNSAPSHDDDVQFVGVEQAASSAAPVDDDIVFVGLVSNSQPETSSKSKKPRPVEDDHAVKIENAIANALKKKGIEPPMPKKLTPAQQAAADGVPTTSGFAAEHSGDTHQQQSLQQQQQQQPPQQSRNNRRRKRKKNRDREQKDKEQQKRARRDSMEEPAGSEDMDEYEMLNMRGGSPPPATAPAATAAPPARFPPEWAEGYDSPADNYSSYDSYSEDEALGLPPSAAQRRRPRRDKDARAGGGGSNNRKRREQGSDNRRADHKRQRRDSSAAGGGGGNEEKQREPRKLELCKFYLMDCCAKRDKCSYMHKEFPCKYYYLGMECFAGDGCLFHHGEPLNEQLRNILLKHMETAPKEILGDFKRIPREHALGQMSRRHDELCEKFGLDNSWPTSLNAGITRRQEQQQQQQLQHALQQSAATPSAVIPSLLDMVINPPPQVSNDSGCSKPEKKRKSRWADKSNSAAKSSADAQAAAAAKATAAPAAVTPTKALPAHLELANLTNVLSVEHIAKLKQLGISNLEQMLQIPFGQLTEVGLTLLEIGEIQRKAAATEHAPSSSSDKAEVTSAISSNSNSNSNGVITVDYTQYLKDANFPFDRNDLPDDDDEQLVIDDGNDLDEQQDEQEQTPQPSPVKLGAEESATGPPADDDVPMPSVFDLPTFMSKMLASNSNATMTTAAPEASATTTKTATTTTAVAAESTVKAASTAATDSYKLSSQLLFGKNDADARAAFYRDIIRNPFKAHSGDADNDNSNSAGELLYGQHDSRSLTPTPTGASSTPEPGSQSPKILDDSEPTAAAAVKVTKYARRSRYDYDPASAEQQAARAAQRKADRDLRTQLVDGEIRDIDMRLPFAPVTHYTPATEVDAAIFSHKLISWTLQEVEVDAASYLELRMGAAYKDQREIRDPRMRRIVGLSELPDRLASEEREHKNSNCISSPESVQMSPRDATPLSPPPHLPSMTVPPPNLAAETAAVCAPRQDPRRDPRRSQLTANSSGSHFGTTAGSNVSGSRQIAEIRNLLQTSNWYNNLGSNNKIMINQQLALVFTELNKYHQQDQQSPNKIFDVSFIVNNRTLQQIFAQLHIYIDDNGLVAQLMDDAVQGNAGGNGGAVNAGAAGPNLPLLLPNMSQPPPNLVQLLRQPPPNMCNPLGAGLMGLPPFSQPPPNNRPSLLGMPPVNNVIMGVGIGNNGNNPFNPFGAGIGNVGIGVGPVAFNGPQQQQQLNGSGCGPIGNFKNFGGPGNHHPAGGNGNRHFGGGGNNRHHRGGNNRNRNI